MKADRAEIVKSYRACQSIRPIQRETGISDGTIRRILIEEGLYQSQLGEKIHEMHNNGMTIDEVTVALKTLAKRLWDIFHINKEAMQPMNRLKWHYESVHVARGRNSIQNKSDLHIVV